MKLAEVQLREKVPTFKAPSDTTQRLMVSKGWDMTLDAGIVTARTGEKGEHTLMIPMSNVLYVIPLAPEPKKADKPGPTKAA